MSEEQGFCEAFSVIADLAAALDVHDISQLPGAWEYRVDDNWRIAVNGHTTELSVAPAGCMEVTIPQFAAVVWWNGWLAGLLTPYGGTIVQHPSGEGASEDALIAALRKATTEAAAAQ